MLCSVCVCVCVALLYYRTNADTAARVGSNAERNDKRGSIVRTAGKDTGEVYSPSTFLLFFISLS